MSPLMYSLVDLNVCLFVEFHVVQSLQLPLVSHIITTTFDVSLPSNVFLPRGDHFYAFLEPTLEVETKEPACLRDFSSARSRIHSAYLRDICYDVDPLMLALRRIKHDETATVHDGGILVSADILSILRIRVRARDAFEITG